MTDLRIHVSFDLRIHVSFDPENDRDLHDRLAAESGRSSYDVVSRSEAGEPSEAWMSRARGRISGCDEVVVICGEHTDESAAPRFRSNSRSRSKKRSRTS
jgi:hypothetical protein